MPEFEFKGKIESVLVPAIILNLTGLKKTGILTLESFYTTLIYFYNGSVVFAESDDRETLLGIILLKNGRIDEEVYEQVLREAEKENKKERTGEFLISRGVITPHELNRFLEIQVKERIVRALTYPEGCYSFQETSEFVNRIFFCDLKLSELLFSSLSSSLKVEEVEFDKVILTPKPQLIEYISNLGLGPRQLRIVQRLTKQVNALEILETEQVGKKDFAALLLYLWFSDLIVIGNLSPYSLCLSSFKAIWGSKDTGLSQEEEYPVIELKDEIPKEMIGKFSAGVTSYEETSSDPVEGNMKRSEEPKETEPDFDLQRIEKDGSESSGSFKPDKSDTEDVMQFYRFVMEEDDSFRILGIAENCTDDEVKEAYFDLVKKFHPDANPHFPEDIREKAQDVFAKVTQAYHKIDTKEKREAYGLIKDAERFTGKIEEIREAELFFQEAELMLRRRMYQEALDKFSKAVEINPDEPAYIGALAWARFLSSGDKNVVVSDIIKELERAKSLNPDIAENLYYLGSLYKFVGDLEKAEENFSKAVKIDPNHLQAKRELRLIQNRKNENRAKKRKKDKFGVGFFSNLFKK